MPLSFVSQSGDTDALVSGCRDFHALLWWGHLELYLFSHQIGNDYWEATPQNPLEPGSSLGKSNAVGEDAPKFDLCEWWETRLKAVAPSEATCGGEASG